MAEPLHHKNASREAADRVEASHSTAERPLDRAELSACACFNLRAAARQLTRSYDEALRPVGLKGNQFTILAVIALVGSDLPIGALAERLSMERTTLVRNLRPLEREGLVRVLPEGYRRSRGVELTEQGLEVLAAALPLWREVQGRTLAHLETGAWDTLRHDIGRLARG